MKHRRRLVGDARIKIPNRTSIHEWPKEADGRRFGDLEMDTIVGKNNKGAIVTIIDRSTDWLIMRKLPHGKFNIEVQSVDRYNLNNLTYRSTKMQRRRQRR